MKYQKATLLILFIVFAGMGLHPAWAQSEGSVAGEGPLVIADFDSGKKPANIGGDFGSWNYAPNDETQGCWDWFETVNYDGKDGYSISLEYDVQSPNPAFCGFWLKLKNINVDSYDVMSFWLKGNEVTGFTGQFKVELRSKRGSRAVYTVTGIDENWQEFRIPFKQTRAIGDWSSLQEFTIVFDDILATKRVGKIFFDQLVFRKFTPEELKAQSKSEAVAQTD